jgi:NADH/NAD ratio-sensing transcriptional regulator Rex
MSNVAEEQALLDYRSSHPHKNRKLPKYKESMKMRIKTNVKAGGISMQHNQRITRSLKVKSGVKAGAVASNHSQTVTRNLKVKSGVKAGLNFTKFEYR